jgi:restriction system protein
MWPTVKALRTLGGSARVSEIYERVVEQEGFTEEQQAIRRSPDHSMSLLEYRLAWARNYLKNIGVVENSARGVWSLTRLGRRITEQEIPDLVKLMKANDKYWYQNWRTGRGGLPPEPPDFWSQLAAGIDAGHPPPKW